LKDGNGLVSAVWIYNKCNRILTKIRY